MKVRKRKKGLNFINILAIVTLIAAWWFGASREAGVLPLLSQNYPDAVITPQEGSDYTFTLLQADGRPASVYVSTGKGYGGPLVVQYSVDERNRIRDVELLSHVDTPGYVVNVKNQRFLQQFEGKLVSDNFVVGDDIDGVSGATLTSNGITHAIQISAHGLAVQRGEAKDWPGKSYSFEFEEAALIALVLLALFERQLPAQIRKYHEFVEMVLDSHNREDENEEDICSGDHFCIDCGFSNGLELQLHQR